jgi:hypothetical protein
MPIDHDGTQATSVLKNMYVYIYIYVYNYIKYTETNPSEPPRTIRNLNMYKWQTVTFIEGPNMYRQPQLAKSKKRVAQAWLAPKSPERSRFAAYAALRPVCTKIRGTNTEPCIDTHSSPSPKTW